MNHYWSYWFLNHDLVVHDWSITFYRAIKLINLSCNPTLINYNTAIILPMFSSDFLRPYPYYNTSIGRYNTFQYLNNDYIGAKTVFNVKMVMSNKTGDFIVHSTMTWCSGARDGT